jgi:hypothetical protein
MRQLKIKSLPNRKIWVDKDEEMLHACFQLLVDYIEEEKGDTHCCYETHKDFVDELRFLYDWWKVRSIAETDSDEDDEMLIRLMKIRKALWT